MKNNNKNNNNINIKTIWKTIRSKKFRKYSFVIFYIFFFIFLFIFMTTNNSNNNIENDYVFPYNIKYLENKNYNFNYSVNYNENESLFVGKRLNNQILLYDDRGEFKFEYKNGNLIRIDNTNLNIPYYNLIDIYEIKKLLKNSKLISETKLNETKEFIYNYTIKNKYLNEIFDDNNALDLENEIIVKTNSLKEVKEIKLDLLNYINSKCIIEIIYGDINE